ncbi:MAG TPA: ubiquinol-cytochrome c reductase iron-sulfur subunit [Pirellulales bacterium]|nr:ubiquinol-cytochrome c reductase iron-sulfur subunit [Pirellulales bacterium]
MAESPPISKPAAAKPKPATSAKSGGGRLSVAEMMAAARADKERLAAGEAPAAAAKPATATPAAKPAAAKPAAAKAAAATPKPAAAEKAAEKVAAKPASKALAEPLPSASILAAARGEKPGPMTKAEAAARPPAARAPATAAKAKLAVPPMPPKPAYAVPKPKTAATEERRGVLALLVGSFLGLGFTALSVTGGVWSLLTARFMFPNVLNEPPSKFPVGPPDSISAGQVETKYKSQHVWIVNYEYKGKKEIFALRTVCTHLGCTPNWLEGEQKFKCPCHGSGYYKDGVNFEGPAPRPLERYAIHIGDDGQLEVDTSKTFHEELGQWTDPNSFVPV